MNTGTYALIHTRTEVDKSGYNIEDLQTIGTPDGHVFDDMPTQRRWMQAGGAWVWWGNGTHPY